MAWFSILTGGLSAICWLLAAVIPPAVVHASYDGPPKNIARRVKLGSFFNAVAAIFAAITMALQSYAQYQVLTG